MEIFKNATTLGVCLQAFVMFKFKMEVLNMSTLELWHLINGKYVHIIQITNGARRTYYTDGKKEGEIDITGPMYAKRKYELETYTIKTSDGEYERVRAKR